MQALCRRLIEQAKAGTWVAAKLLLACVLGRPAAAVDPDTLDLHEWRLFQPGPARPDEVVGVLDGLPPAMTCELLRHVTPCVATALNGDGLEQLTSAATLLT